MICISEKVSLACLGKGSTPFSASKIKGSTFAKASVETFPPFTFATSSAFRPSKMLRLWTSRNSLRYRPTMVAQRWIRFLNWPRRMVGRLVSAATKAAMSFFNNSSSSCSSPSSEMGVFISFVAWSTLVLATSNASSTFLANSNISASDFGAPLMKGSTRDSAEITNCSAAGPAAIASAILLFRATFFSSIFFFRMASVALAAACLA
mmetsp:Transcript_23794/g.60064  ORF Transcript_23794/g.60064 Transcript_23794/m.60064 type:complete len:207 (+) Transcript_23794:932-1552(+)